MSQNETNREQDATDGDSTSRTGMTLARTCMAVAVFYVALLLLNGKGIHDKMSKLEYGSGREILMTVTAPFNAVSEFTRLCTLRDTASRWAGTWLNDSL